jgi:hypothetical protein
MILIKFNACPKKLFVVTHVQHLKKSSIHTKHQTIFQTPAGFFAFLAIALIIIISLNQQGNISEFRGVLLSTIIVTILWIIMQQFLAPSRLWKDIAFGFNILFFLKIIAGFAHFYFFYAPTLGITSASEVLFAKVSGDMVAIHKAALVFMSQREAAGIMYAIFGDYSRSINNYGVGIIYGLLYGSFGKYPTVAIPWNALAMGLASLVIGAIGEVLKVDRKDTKLAMILLFIMPIFFISVPIYRDQFMLLLILLLTYASLYAVINGNLLDIILIKR